MLFKKVTKDLGVGIYLWVSFYGEKISFEICDTSSDRRLVFVGGEVYENVTDVAEYYAPFPEIEYE